MSVQIFKSPPEEADLVDAKVNMSTSQNMESSFSSSVGRPRVLGNHMTSSQEQNSSGGVASERTQQRTPPTRIYANQAPVHPSRIRPRPIQMYPANAGQIWHFVVLSVLYKITKENKTRHKWDTHMHKQTQYGTEIQYHT